MRSLRNTLGGVGLALAVCALVSAGSTQDPRQAIRAELPSLLPPGANLYLGFTDLQADLQRLGASELWSRYVEGNNHASFIRSRLWLRFEERLTSLEMVVGGPLDGPALQRMAGSTCALAFYQVGDIEFVYLGRAELAAALLAELGEMAGDFQPRRHGDVDYQLARDDLRGLELAWAVHGGYVVVSDEERLLQATLDRIDGRGAALADDSGFRRTVAALPPTGDQLVYLNVEALRDDGYFRTYWMQHDRELLARHEAYGATVVWEEGRVTEHRFLAADVPASGAAPSAPDPAEVYRLLPGDALVAKAVAAVDPAEAAATFLDGGRGDAAPVDAFRTPLHDLLAAGDLSREQFDALVGDRFAVAVTARPYDATFTVLDRVVLTHPVDAAAAERALARVRERLPVQVAERLAGDVQRPFPLRGHDERGVRIESFDLVTAGIYAPAFAMVDGWLVLANNPAGVRAVIDAAAGGSSLAGRPDLRALSSSDPGGPLRQTLLVDAARSRAVYDDVVGAMERGDAFSSWAAREFWTVRMRDLLDVLAAIEGVQGWSTETAGGLRGETVYLLAG